MHGKTVEEIDLRSLPWFTNLEAVEGPRDARAPDEMARLRELQEKARGEVQRRSW